MYPFRPKSTARMKDGQFWGIPLQYGAFACGIVLSIKRTTTGTRDSRRFWAGILDWFGACQPNAEAIRGRKIVAHAFAHIKTITDNGGDIIGEVSPWWNWPAEIDVQDDIHTWEYMDISILAEKLRTNASKKWYLSWEPGAPDYTHDEAIIAVGLRCDKSEVRLIDIFLWLGAPDKVDGNAKEGNIAYFFNQQFETAAFFNVIDGRICNFGTITRSTDNTKMTDKETGEVKFFNVLDTMEDFIGSEMQKNTEPLA